MMRGLLNWLIKNFRKAYFTRSATVARVAIYLKVVGYEIGVVCKWDGQDELPQSARSVVLVLGGSSLPDPFMEIEISSFMDPLLISHYRFSTVGAFMLNTIRCKHHFYPEVYQDYFNSTYQDLKTRLTFSWEHFDWEGDDDDDDCETELFAIPHWLSSLKVYYQMAVRLSSIYFAKCAQHMVLRSWRNWRQITCSTILACGSPRVFKLSSLLSFLSSILRYSFYIIIYT
jgi:hypothetical protein